PANRTRYQAHRAAGPGGAPGDPRTARTAAATPRTRVPSPTRRRPPGQCRTQTRAAPDTPAVRSCRLRPPRAAPAPGSDPRAPSPPADPAPRARGAGQAAAALKREPTSSPTEPRNAAPRWATSAPVDPGPRDRAPPGLHQGP